MPTPTHAETATSAPAPTESTGGIGALGLDLQRFEGQLVTFVILLLIMWRWVYRPLLKKMDERATKIEQGLAFSVEAEKAKTDARKEFDRIVTQAKAEAHAILKENEEKALALKHERLAQVKVEIEKIALEAKAQIKAERQASYDALRGDIADLVSSALVKVVGTLDEKTRKTLVSNALEELKK